MKKWIALLLFFFIGENLVAQFCDCKTEFAWVKSYMEKNHPGFNSDIRSPLEPAYKAFTDELIQSIAADKTGRYCMVYLKRYIRYLKDHHSNIFESFPPVDEKNPDSLRAFLQSSVYLNTEKISYDSASLIQSLANARPGDVEGIYINADTTYTVAVIRNKTVNRDYVGILIATRAKTWEKGQVKFEIKERKDGYREGFFYMRNHSLNYEEWQPDASGSPINGWIKIYPSAIMARKNAIDNELISFKELDKQTAYISIRSFAGQFTTQLDSAYQVIIPKIRNYPRLIVDVRGNGGGSDRNYLALMPFLYTDTIYNDFVELFVTEDNRNAYQKMMEEAKAQPEKWGKTGYQSWQFRLNQMKSVPVNSFVAISPKGSKSYYKRENNPSKIALLYDRNCASSCEQLLIDASFSKKAILVGEPSGGFIAYGNVMSIQTPCGRILNWTTTRKNKDRQYEFVGIKPSVVIPKAEEDWIAFTQKLLSQ